MRTKKDAAGDLRRRMIEEMQLRRYSERTQTSEDVRQSYFCFFHAS